MVGLQTRVVENSIQQRNLLEDIRRAGKGATRIYLVVHVEVGWVTQARSRLPVKHDHVFINIHLHKISQTQSK